MAKIKHMVIFCLSAGKDSPEAEKFMSDGRTLLSSIPVVKNFEALRQVSVKNDYDFGFSMVFDGDAEYEEYNNHPTHKSFVADRWVKEVSRFLEIDFREF
ncbi:MAG: Dabb family protein [Eubacteriales bacterium]